MEHPNAATPLREPWNKGKLVGQKAPFKLKDIWAIRIRLQITNRIRDLALFRLGHRQQVEGVRPGETACPRYITWWSRRGSRPTLVVITQERGNRYFNSAEINSVVNFSPNELRYSDLSGTGFPEISPIHTLPSSFPLNDAPFASFPLMRLLK